MISTVGGGTTAPRSECVSTGCWSQLPTDDQLMMPREHSADASTVRSGWQLKHDPERRRNGTIRPEIESDHLRQRRRPLLSDYDHVIVDRLNRDVFVPELPRNMDHDRQLPLRFVVSFDGYESTSGSGKHAVRHVFRSLPDQKDSVVFQLANEALRRGLVRQSRLAEDFPRNGNGSDRQAASFADADDEFFNGVGSGVDPGAKGAGVKCPTQRKLPRLL